jgi:type I restriction enzyme S subunit
MSEQRKHAAATWEQDYRLGDGCTIKHGFACKGEFMTTDGSVAAPIVVNIVNFQYSGGFRFGETKIQRYLGSYPREYELRGGDVLLVMTCQTPKGEILGVPGRIPADGRTYLHNQRMGLAVLKDTSSLDLGFLYYLFLTSQFNSHLFQTATGAKILHTAPTRIEAFRFPRPPLLLQQRIASILFAYDDLIENNTRRIKILEQMAQMLYKEWFVNFRFPGHEGCPLITSDLGEIPKGWQVSSLGDVTTKIGSGATPRGGKGSYQREGIRLIRSLNIYDYSFEMANLAFINDEQAEQLNNVTIEPNDVLLNITGASVGRCSMVPSSLLPARVNQHVAIVRAKCASIDPFFLLDSINNDRNKQRLLGIAQGGATREALTKDSITGFPILLPPLDLIRRYGQVAGLFHTQREKLNLRNENLRTTRDLLLPKLVSGEVSIEQIEKDAVAQMV